MKPGKMRKKQLLCGLLSAVLLTAGCAQARPKNETTQQPVPSSQTNPPLPAETDSTEATLCMEIDEKSFLITLYNNETAEAFLQLLPLTLEMHELNGNEKFCYLDHTLPAKAQKPSQIHAGDLMLYQKNCLVLFYESFSTSYSYTPLGYTQTPAELARALHGEKITVRFRLQEST